MSADFRVCETVRGEFKMIYSEDVGLAVFFKNRTSSVSLMPFSGVKDKEGHKIYDSDIIEHENRVYIVFFDEYHARFALKNIDTNRVENDFRRITENSNIIGNTMENESFFKERKRNF